MPSRVDGEDPELDQRLAVAGGVEQVEHGR